MPLAHAAAVRNIRNAVEQINKGVRRKAQGVRCKELIADRLKRIIGLED